MSRVEVRGRDAGAEAYRIRVEIDGRQVSALVPECLMAGLRPGDRPSHQEAYEWIAAHRRDLSRAVGALAAGRQPRPPYDIVTLETAGDG
ncbi:hypothetical protein [Roseivivax sp. CAU 1761]